MTGVNLLGVVERWQALVEAWVEPGLTLGRFGWIHLESFVLPWPWADSAVGMGGAAPEIHPRCPLPGGSVHVLKAMAGFLLGNHSTPLYLVTK